MNTHTTNLPAIETHTFPNSHIISCLNLNLAQIAAFQKAACTLLLSRIFLEAIKDTQG